jgi:hypothetical protein
VNNPSMNTSLFKCRTVSQLKRCALPEIQWTFTDTRREKEWKL